LFQFKISLILLLANRKQEKCTMSPKTIALISLALALPTAFAHAATTVQQLDWISGHWCSSGNGEKTEEIWLPAHGDVMVGMSRTRDGDRTSGFEYMRIVMVDQRPGFIAQPGGQPPVTFLRTDGDRNWVRFENPEHDFPQRIEYRRRGNTLHARISGPGKDGKEFEISFEFVPCS
jgi:hypothetical protein